MMVRPEVITLHRIRKGPHNELQGTVTEKYYLGNGSPTGFP
ncbi:MAG: hypothetical protein CM1200mP20_10520 [Pseudomonadota bacterium]|nr:MAG: hypothetical protein CM1200mP20_10520 [Pseudomonadota bacterium]